MDEKKINQKGFADEMGFSKQQVSKWLSGYTGIPRRQTLHKIAEYFGCNVDWLATGKGQKYPNTGVINFNLNERLLGGKTEDLDLELLREIQAWLRAQKKNEPEFAAWFRIEFGRHFPEFMEWRQKNIKNAANG